MTDATDPSSLAYAISTADGWDFWPWTIILCLVALGCVIIYYSSLQGARAVEDTPTSKIRSAAQGYVELEGTAIQIKGEPTIAPLTGKEAVWYRFIVEKRYTGHRGSHRWSTVESVESDTCFSLVDDTDMCIIDPEGAFVESDIKDTWFDKTYPTEEMRQSSPKTFANTDNGFFRFTEERIHPGTRLYAIGHFESSGGDNNLGNKKEEIRHLLTTWKQDKKTLLQRFDTDGDGNIDMQEWQAAQEAAVQEVDKDRLERASNPIVHVLSEPESKPFILSVKEQHAVASGLKKMAFGTALASIITGSCAVWLLMARLG